MPKYTIGLDFGTLSGRAVLVDVSTGVEVATKVKEYKNGVISDTLHGTNIKLKEDWALQDPSDYLDVMYDVIPEVIKEAKVNKEDIIGVGVDFTACTILPIDKEGNPLCLDERYKSNPHSFVKLWKHHAAQYEANKLNDIAEKRGEAFLSLYGGKISSEWMIPKLMQIVDESPEVYDAAEYFIEGGDYIVYRLTGEIKRNCCAAGFKATWNSTLGYPSKEFLRELNPRLENLVEEKLSKDIYPIGGRAGYISREMAEKLGLSENTAVAIASVDAHVAAPAVGAISPGKMVLIIGTSTCNILVDEKEVMVPGISGVVKDSVIPGYFGYEAGQAAVGDIFDWYINNCVPESYYKEAKDKGISIFKLLCEKASKLKAGGSGLLCLDWLNGCRSTLVDADLQGMMLGITLSTKPEEVYRALIEATAYGQNMIVETFRENGIDINEIYACGGIAHKDTLLMQIYADVLNVNIRVAESMQAVAVGSSILAAVAAGKDAGGYDSIEEAAKHMVRLLNIEYKPDPLNVKIYREIYEEYKKLYNYFGKENNVMKILKRIKLSADEL